MTDLIMTVLAQNRQIKSVIKLGAKVRTVQRCLYTILTVANVSNSYFQVGQMCLGTSPR